MDTHIHTNGSPNHASGDEDRSLADVIKDITAHTQQLVKGEIELLRAEMTDNFKHAGKYAAMGAAAAVFAVCALIFLGHTVAQALDNVMGEGLSYLVITLVFAAVAAGLGLAAKKGFQKTPLAPNESVQSAKEDIQWVKTHA